MAKGKRGREEEVETYESDGGFVEEDEDAPKSKKSKKAQSSSKSGAKKPKGDEENRFWEISTGRQPRRVEVSEYKNAKLVNIREYYEKGGDYLPGKKGISLNIDQYKAFLQAIPEINAHLSSLGVDVSDTPELKDESEEEEEEKPKKRAKTKKTGKANIETTSDEEDD